MERSMQSLCIIAHSPGVTAKLHGDLERIFSSFIRVQSWSLDTSQEPPEPPSDLYLASFPSVFEAVKSILRKTRGEEEIPKVLLAKRILSPVHFNRLLQLPTGTRVLIAGNSKLACSVLHQAMQDFGICHLKTEYHYPEHMISMREGIRIAVVTGVNKWIPEWIDTVIDVGVKDFALTTYNSVIRTMGMPESLLDEISKQYTIPIFAVTKGYYEESNKVNALLQCIEDVVFTIDLNGYIAIHNKAAADLLAGRGVERNIHIRTVFPDLQIDFPLRAHFSLHDVIVSGNSQHYILQIESIGEALGAVVLARQVKRVQELEGIVRTELKPLHNATRYVFEDIFTQSKELRHTIDLARRFAATRATILLEGESGVGKEVFAHAIHAASERANKPFVAINLAAMPENLAESELFGYVDGSFTGARKGGRRGLFEEAHQGTLFLDEIGDAPLPLQSKLLRAIEEREIRRVGGSGPIPVDVRIIAATNRPLEFMTREGTFRTDLFYRLCACPLSIPPLRARSEDILPLAEHFANRDGRTLHLDGQTRTFLEEYKWPGNIRELNNIVHYILHVSRENTVTTLDCLPRYLLGNEHNNEWSGGHSEPSSEEHQFAQTAEAMAAARMLSAAEAILGLLEHCDKQGMRVGRETLFHQLKDTGNGISMYGLRQCLKEIEKAGFIKVGISRQGCLPTDLGLHFLSWLRTHRPIAKQTKA